MGCTGEVMKITRFEQSNIDEQYKRNCERAAEYFSKYIQYPDGFVIYAQMLKDMHQIMNSNYKGYTKSKQNFADVDISNNFRDELQTELDSHNPPLLWYIIWYENMLSDLAIGNSISPDITDIPKRALPKLIRIDTDNVKLELCNKKYIHYYLEQMENLMRSLIDDKKEKLQFLFDLAHYIQLFICCHPFEKINNSICMLQVNILLKRKFNITIYHEWLDFECFVYNTNSIYIKLRDTILRAYEA